MSAQTGLRSSRAIRVASKLWRPSRSASSVTSIVRVIARLLLRMGITNQPAAPGTLSLALRAGQESHTVLIFRAEVPLKGFLNQSIFARLVRAKLTNPGPNFLPERAVRPGL